MSGSGAFPGPAHADGCAAPLRCRRLVAETTLGVDDLVAPLFVREGVDAPVPIASMPGHFQHTVPSLLAEAKRLASLGVPGSRPLRRSASERTPPDRERGTPTGSCRSRSRSCAASVGDQLVLIADLCLDEYTDHGHCGVLTHDGSVDNDATLDLYGRVAVAQAVAGADLVAPSGMMDGQVAAIREALDADGHPNVAILAYAAKYASCFYGPFREAVDVTIASGGDRRSYQQDPPNVREALAEIALDVAEGADMVMVKPALPYLDVIAAAAAVVRRARRRVPGERRVRDGAGRRAERLARRRRRSDRAADRDQARGRTCGAHVLRRPGGRASRRQVKAPSGGQRRLVRARALGHPGRCQLAGALLPVRGRGAVLGRKRTRAPTSPTSRVAGSSTSSSPTAPCSSVTLTPS